MTIFDLLDSSSPFRHVPPKALFRADDQRALLPDDQQCLARAYEVLVRLNAEEIRRFDAFTRKAGSLLAASGLMLTISSLGLTRLSDLHHADSRLYFPAMAAFLLTIGTFFLATWNAMMSIRSRPCCCTDEALFCDPQNKPVDHAVLQKDIAASELAAYKNNVEIVNEKGTQANTAFRYFFIGCCGELSFVFLLVAALISSPAASETKQSTFKCISRSVAPLSQPESSGASLIPESAP